jgi:sulfate transport system ATP-binding protein
VRRLSKGWPNWSGSVPSSNSADRNPKSAKPSCKAIGKLLDLIKQSGFADRYPSQLSGGQRQRIALARAVEPQMLLLDEPFGALDAQVRKELRRWLREIHERTGQTTIFVTHDQDEALDLSDRVAVLGKGRLEQVGTPDEVQERPASATLLKFLGDTIEVEAIPVGGRLLVNDRDTPLRAPEGVAGPVKLYARPWQLQFADPGSAHLHGTVRSSYRTQGRQRIEIDRPGELTVVIEAPDDVRLTAGRDIGLRIVSGYVVPWRSEDKRNSGSGRDPKLYRFRDRMGAPTRS